MTTFTTRPELAGTYGMVTSTHWLASQCGMAILEAGGNAFDAAVAAGFTLQVVEPHLNGPGGDLAMIIRAAGRDPQVLCGQGVAPAGASIDHFADLGLSKVPGTGLLAATVPGATPAWLTLLRDHGTMRPADVLQPAIWYAEHGHPVLGRVVDTIESMTDQFRNHWLTSAECWLPAPVRGGLLRNPVLAGTFSRLVQAGESAADHQTACQRTLNAWSEGFVAEAIDRFARRPFLDSSGAEHAGVLTGDDLVRWEPTYDEPMTLDWRGQRVYKTPGWGQGPVFLQTLALLDPLVDSGLPGLMDGSGFGPDEIHLVVEAEKLALADRDAWYGDAPDAPDLAGLFDPAYLMRQRARIGDAASTQLRPGHLDGRRPRLPALPMWETKAAGIGEPTVAADEFGRNPAGAREAGFEAPGHESVRPETVDTVGDGPEATRGDTCHLDVADRWGNVVSATPSGGWLQSSPTIPELGFGLGTRLQMTWLEPGLPSSLTPGRRPRTTLSPSIAIDGGGVVTAFGTPGGDQQDQWAQVFWLAYTLGGANLQAAIDQPSFDTRSMISSFEPRIARPGVLQVEGRYPEGVIEELRRRGHQVEVGPDWSLSRMTAVSYDPDTGILRAAANPRGMQAYAVGR